VCGNDEKSKGGRERVVAGVDDPIMVQWHDFQHDGLKI
jgi:hypothetical protein